MSFSAARCFKGAPEYGYTLIKNTILDNHDDDPLELDLIFNQFHQNLALKLNERKTHIHHIPIQICKFKYSII